MIENKYCPNCDIYTNGDHYINTDTDLWYCGECNQPFQLDIFGYARVV